MEPPELVLYRGMAECLLPCSEEIQDLKKSESSTLPPLAEAAAWAPRPKMPIRKFYDHNAFCWKNAAPREPKAFACTARICCRGALAVAKCYSCAKFDAQGRGWMCIDCLKKRHPWYRAPHKIVPIAHEEAVEREFQAQICRADVHRLKASAAKLMSTVQDLKERFDEQVRDPKSGGLLKTTARKLVSVEQRAVKLRCQVHQDPFEASDASYDALRSSALSQTSVAINETQGSSPTTASASVASRREARQQPSKWNPHNPDDKTAEHGLKAEAERESDPKEALEIDASPSPRKLQDAPSETADPVNSSLVGSSGSSESFGSSGTRVFDEKSRKEKSFRASGGNPVPEVAALGVPAAALRVQSVLGRRLEAMRAQALRCDRFERMFGDYYAQWFHLNALAE